MHRILDRAAPHVQEQKCGQFAGNWLDTTRCQHAVMRLSCTPAFVTDMLFELRVSSSNGGLQTIHIILCRCVVTWRD